MKQKKRFNTQKARVAKLVLAEPYLETEPRELWLKYVTKYHGLKLTDEQELIILGEDTPSMGAVDRTLRKIKDTK